MRLFAQKDAADFVFRPSFDQTLRRLREKSGAGFFVSGEAACERISECTEMYMTEVSEQPTKPGAKRTSENVLGYMVKRLSAHGGCLGSKRR